MILIKQYMCRRKLNVFIAEAFKVLNPGVTFLSNWHIDLIAEYLEAVTTGHVKRLIINIPPRYMKSTCVSVCWPAWLLGIDPTRRILCSSYSHGLAIKHSIDTRHLILSDFYQQLFKNVSIDPSVNNKLKFITTQRGFRFSTSVGGTITGEGGNFLILDDPYNAMQVHSTKYRERAIQWFQQSFMSRLDNKKEGVVVIVMQRLHPHDLTGHLLAHQSSNWHHLDIPAVAEKTRAYSVGKYFYQVNKGDLLHQEREGGEEIANIEKELGSFAFNAQYMQLPVNTDFGMLKVQWLRYCDIVPNLDLLNIIQSWDTALKLGDNHSYSVCTTWGENDEGYYLLDVVRERFEYPELKQTVVENVLRWKPGIVLIEDKASGQSLIQDVILDDGPLIVPVKPCRDKITRFARITPLFEQGKIVIMQNNLWCHEYQKEILAFPAGNSDDQVDSTSQFLNFCLDRKRIFPRVR